jgi:hypothetical protein
LENLRYSKESSISKGSPRWSEESLKRKRAESPSPNDDGSLTHQADSVSQMITTDGAIDTGGEFDAEEEMWNRLRELMTLEKLATSKGLGKERNRSFLDSPNGDVVTDVGK